MTEKSNKKRVYIMNENRRRSLRSFIALREKVVLGLLTVEQCRTELSRFIYLSDIDEPDKLAKEYEKSLEIILRTLSPGQVQVTATLKVLDEVLAVLNRRILLQNLITLHEEVATDLMTLEECQSQLSHFIYLSDVDEQEKLAKEYDNKLEIILHTLSAGQTRSATLKTLDEVIRIIRVSLTNRDD